MLDSIYTSKNKKQGIYADIIENYAFISASEHSENNVVFDINALKSLPINEPVDILNENFPGLNLNPPKQDWSTSKVVGAVTIFAALGYAIKRIGCPSRKKSSQSSPTNNPSEPSGSNQGQLLSQSMAGASMGDRSIPRRPLTRSERRSQGNLDLPNNGNDPLNN
jgi:hypothetical protein